jgi:hypothetical protein
VYFAEAATIVWVGQIEVNNQNQLDAPFTLGTLARSVHPAAPIRPYGQLVGNSARRVLRTGPTGLGVAGLDFDRTANDRHGIGQPAAVDQDMGEGERETHASTAIVR